MYQQLGNSWELSPGNRGNHHNITSAVGSCHHDQIPDMENPWHSSWLTSFLIGVAEDLVMMVGDSNEAWIVWRASDKIFIGDPAIGAGLPGMVFPDNVEICSSDFRISPQG